MSQAPGGTRPSSPNPHVLSDTPALSWDIPNIGPSDPDQLTPTIPSTHEPIKEGLAEETHSEPLSPDPSDRAASAPDSSHAFQPQAPAENLPSQASPSAFPNCSSTRIVLEQGFDQLPAILHLLKGHGKSICFWRHWGSFVNVIKLIQNNVLKAPVAPGSFKQNALKEAAEKFAEVSEGVLIWPAHLPFQGALDTSVQIIYVGEPFQENIDLETSKVVMVITRSGWTDLSSDTRKSMDKKYPLEPMNRLYNQQRATAILQAERQHMRSYLSHRKSAHSFFTAWIVSEHKHNPTWSAKKLADRANRYAEEYLLYGGRSKKERLGRRFSLARTHVQTLNLWPAVHARILLVG